MVALTVILPVRDAEPYLDAAVDSIRQQTFADFELLIIDDASSDGSVDTASRHAKQDPRIHVLANTGRGLVAALNFGIERARAPLIARMDADDIAMPTRFDLQVAHMTDDPGLAVLGTGWIRNRCERATTRHGNTAP